MDLDLQPLINRIRAEERTIIFMEGTRLSGKTTTAFQLLGRLQETEPWWRYYSTFRNRKAFSDRYRQALLAEGQAPIFTLDLALQQPDLRLICDRSSLTAPVFAQLYQLFGEHSWIHSKALDLCYKRLDLFWDLLADAHGLLVYMDTTLGEIEARATAEARSGEFESIQVESRLYHTLLGQCPRPELLHWLQPTP